jgi:hypothetical protein
MVGYTAPTCLIYKQMQVMMKNRDDLIYDLIFSDEVEFDINISEYIENIYKYESFIKEIKEVLKKSKVSIVKEGVDLNPTTAIWILKVKR